MMFHLNKHEVTITHQDHLCITLQYHNAKNFDPSKKKENFITMDVEVNMI